MMTEDDDQQAAVWVVLIGVVLLAVGLTVGVGLQRSLKSEGSNAAAVPVRTMAAATDNASQEPSTAQTDSAAAAADSASQDANANSEAASSTTTQAAHSATVDPSGDSAVASGEAQNADANTESTAAQASDSDSNATSAEVQTADATNADNTASTGSAPAVAAATSADASADSDAPSLRVDEDKVTFYFASGKADLAEGAPEALAEIIKGVAIGQTAVISGYHDPTGDLARNQELARARAEAVAEALRALGVSEDKLELRKPEQTEAQGQSLAEARRVEVRLQ